MVHSQIGVIDNLRKQRKKLKDTLEAVREFVLSRRYDIEMDVENFGMLKPVLTYFLEETESR